MAWHLYLPLEIVAMFAPFSGYGNTERQEEAFEEAYYHDLLRQREKDRYRKGIVRRRNVEACRRYRARHPEYGKTANRLAKMSPEEQQVFKLKRRIQSRKRRESASEEQKERWREGTRRHRARLASLRSADPAGSTSQTQ